jgi:hypoxanthine phosphoribosyltransferase
MDDSFEDYSELMEDIKEVVITREELRQKVGELGRAISRDYAGKDLLLVGVLKGVLFFMADLVRSISIAVELDFLAVSSYSPDARQKGFVRLEKDLEIPIAGRNVLFIEDVIESGLTLNYLLHNLRGRGPANLDVCVLFNKPEHRLIDIPLKYKGFDLPDRFVVGYGLDYSEKYRNLPFVGLLKPHVLKSLKTRQGL